MSAQLQEDEHVEENGLVTASPENMSEASGDEEDEHVNGNGDVHGNAEIMHARQGDYGSGSEDEDDEEDGEEEQAAETESGQRCLDDRCRRPRG